MNSDASSLRESPAPDVPERSKASYVGAPAIFALEQACQHLQAAFPESLGCYHVGSSLERADWRDVDVRMIFRDEDFTRLFPGAGDVAWVHWEANPRWLLLTVSISAWLKAQSGLPVDFQFQPMSHANTRHRGKRSSLGMRINHIPEDNDA